LNLWEHLHEESGFGKCGVLFISLGSQKMGLLDFPVEMSGSGMVGEP
jgi:hypothetical protein